MAPSMEAIEVYGKWQDLKSKALSVTEEMIMPTIQELNSGLEKGTSNHEEIVKRNVLEAWKDYILVFETKCEGYLLLIKEDERCDRYLLSPSKAFCPNNRIESGEALYLPDKDKGCEGDLFYDLEGSISFIAIITQEPIAIPWVDNDTNTNTQDIDIDERRMGHILDEIGKAAIKAIASREFRVENERI
jgi:hypothetical protein